MNKLKVEYRDINELIPYANNSRTHSEEQILQIASSIKEFGFNNPILIDSEGGVIAGHGRISGAHKLNMKEVPTITLEGLTKAQKKAYVIADNKIALNSGWDEEMLKVEMEELEEMDFSLDSIGFDDQEIDEILGGTMTTEGLEGAGDEAYTQKVSAPIYEPTGEKPELNELFDIEKYRDMKKKIEASDIPEDEKDFLILAASRHIIFDYGKVADYYAHSEAEAQDLMEDSALVIIDFKKALELGYVKLADDIKALYGIEHNE